MSQNLISLELPAETLAALDRAIETLEEVVKPFISLSRDEVRTMVKMGDKSEQFCRQTVLVLEQNQHILPPTFKLADIKSDMTAFDTLRPRVLRLREALAKAEDTQMALGSDILAASLEGYSLMKMFGKNEGLETLRHAMAARLPRSKGTQPAATAQPTASTQN